MIITSTQLLRAKEEKQNSFMNPVDVAKTILDNVLSKNNLTIADIIIERNS